MICSKHKEEKVSYGSQLKCKSCNRDYQREWLARNRSVQNKRIRANNTSARQRNREFVRIFLLGHPCVDCGEADPIVLEFDHKDPSDKVKGVSQLVASAAAIETLEKEIDKCEVRCANCHRRKTAVQFGWHGAVSKKVKGPIL